MRIVNDFPPNINEIEKKFDLDGSMPVFAYGDVLYNPTGGPIADHLMIHEETHERQQKVYGSVQSWWKRYLEDDMFRLTQEVEAYRNQYKSVKGFPRDWRRKLLKEMVKNLSGKLYGNIVNEEQAKDLIINV
jgi:hypothetical protein